VSVLEALDVATRRYLRLHPPVMNTERWKDLRIDSFTPSMNSLEVICRIYALAHDGQLYYQPVVIDKTELQLVMSPSAQLLDMLRDRIDTALQALDSYVEDPFEKWVRETRKEAGIDDGGPRGPIQVINV
jgi:hypothetical protein